MLHTDSGMKLIGLSEPYEGKEFSSELDEYIIGRALYCDLVLTEATVSGKHAKIVRQEDRFELIDLDSSNGTYVNNKKISRKILNAKDEISFDKVKFCFVPTTGIDDQEAVDDIIQSDLESQDASKEEVKTSTSPAAEEVIRSTVIRPRFEIPGKLFLGIISGLLVSLVLGLGGATIAFGLKSSFIESKLDYLISALGSFPSLHTHTTWLENNWSIPKIVEITSITIALLAGGLLAQTIGKRKRFLTAFFLSITYVLAIFIIQFIVFSFDLETILNQSNSFRQSLLGILPANMQNDGALIALYAEYLYFFGVSYILCLLGVMIKIKK